MSPRVPQSTPLLVTGLPRSGTTWLARLLASAAGTAMPGREPMNPRGRQFALGGTVDAWVRLGDRMTGQQQRRLRRVYRGLEPRVYSRYGVNQWRAPLPRTRIVIKDPFALLSVRTVAAVTGARPVVVYRHPAAIWASYRRMGWSPDIEELSRLGLPDAGDAPPDDADDVTAMAWFWRVCHATALRDLEHCEGAVLVDHAELSRGGTPAGRALFAELGLSWSHRADQVFDTATDPAGSAAPADPPLGPSTGSRAALHRLGRTPATVAESWRATVSPDVITRLEAGTAPVLDQLSAVRLALDLA